MQAVQMKVRDRLESVCRKVAGWALKSNVRLSPGASQCVQVRNEIVEQSRPSVAVRGIFFGEQCVKKTVDLKLPPR